MSASTNSTSNPSPEACGRAGDALDYVRLDEIAPLAPLASSYWSSIALAADRGDALTAVTHCKQVAAVTRKALTLAAELHPENLVNAGGAVKR